MKKYIIFFQLVGESNTLQYSTLSGLSEEVISCLVVIYTYSIKINLLVLVNCENLFNFFQLVGEFNTLQYLI